MQPFVPAVQVAQPPPIIYRMGQSFVRACAWTLRLLRFAMMVVVASRTHLTQAAIALPLSLTDLSLIFGRFH